MEMANPSDLVDLVFGLLTSPSSSEDEKGQKSVSQEELGQILKDSSKQELREEISVLLDKLHVHEWEFQMGGNS